MHSDHLSSNSPKLGVVETQFPKFRWGTVSEPNAGHTQDEWGIKKATKKVIVAYTVAWDKISEEYQYYKIS